MFQIMLEQIKGGTKKKIKYCKLDRVNAGIQVMLVYGTSRKHSKLAASNSDIFFSLVDYRNTLFTSKDPDKIIEFYSGFENREQLIQWMIERPNGISKIHEIEGDKDIIVVILTADFEGEYSKKCRDEIFTGLHMIFIESGEKPDPYFNISHNANIGLQKALEYNPKWIIDAGDDMYKIDDVTALVSQLRRIDNSKIDSVFTSPNSYHSTPSFIRTPNLFFSPTLYFLGIFSRRFRYTYKLVLQLKRLNKRIYLARRDYKIGLVPKLINIFLFRKLKYFTNMISFAIFSSKFINEFSGSPYDELYINEMEETNLSLLLSQHNSESVFIDYQIGQHVGTSLGNDIVRTLRVLPSYSYFSYKIEKGDLSL